VGAVIFRILSLNFRFCIFLWHRCSHSWWSGFTFCRVNKSYPEHCNVYYKHCKADVSTNVDREFFYDQFIHTYARSLCKYRPEVKSRRVYIR